jgi:2-polyprenyl-3-methyl-5-hydroxy-6-metoxy-1,4-benzoquinol methylase
MSSLPQIQWPEDCMACGHRRKARLAFTVAGHQIVRCDGCGHGRAVVADGGFDPVTYYSREYFEGGRHDGYASYGASEATLRAEFRSSVERLRRVAPAGGSLLEIGCAYGYFLREAQATYRCVGVDLSADAIAVARSSGLDAHCGAFDAKTLADRGAFDVATMFDVVEHLAEPQTTLAALAQRVRPGGILMLTTGDFGSLVAKATHARWRLMTPPQHLHFFTVASMRTLLQRAGFTVVAVEHPFKFVPLSLIAYQLTRRFGRPLRLPRSIGSFGLPVNLFDAMRVIARREATPGLCQN